MDSVTKISIHTPTRGVTVSCIRSCSLRNISIHTPTRGVTQSHIFHRADRLFQSTLPQGEWPSSAKVEMTDWSISIHTPTRGVTSCTVTTWPSIQNFNPHSHKGSDNISCMRRSAFGISIHTPTRGVTILHFLFQSYNRFQSTLPQGEWRSRLVYLDNSTNFNPHSHKGSDCQIG